jgi:hypothetical protein
MQEELDRLKAACGRITAASKPEGTGFLIASDRVVTCQHVVEAPGVGSPLAFEAQDERREAHLVCTDPVLDCAILSLREPATAQPLRLSPVGAFASDTWITYGFPRFKAFRGYVCSGNVRDAKAEDDRGIPSLQLYSDDLAAGLGQPLHGLSGAPVVCGGVVVGHVKKGIADRRFVPDNPASTTEFSAAGGVIYASPVYAVLRLLGSDVTAAERHAIEAIARDLHGVRETLGRIGADLSRIEEFAARCIRWRYVQGLIEVRRHQVRVTRSAGVDIYAKALAQLGTAYYLSGDTAMAEQVWSEATGLFRMQVANRTRVDEFEEIIRSARAQPAGSLRTPG